MKIFSYGLLLLIIPNTDNSTILGDFLNDHRATFPRFEDHPVANSKTVYHD